MMERAGSPPRKQACLKRAVRLRLASRNDADGHDIGSPPGTEATRNFPSRRHARPEIPRIEDMNPPRADGTAGQAPLGEWR